MVDLKQKTISGLFWSFIENISGQGITFLVGIVLARILSPKDFGLIGILSIFIAVSQSFIDSGFGQALIRKQDCSEEDYSTVFYFNITIAIILYLILYLCANQVARFFNEPELSKFLRVMGLGIIINAFSLIQTILLVKKLNFRLSARVSIISSLISGIVALILAYRGFGAWSLVAPTLVRYLINASLLWFWNKWQPLLIFSKKSFEELFSFGSKILMSGLIETIYRNLYYFIIGKYYKASELGYYTRADQFQSFPSSNLQSIIGKVSYPVLSTLQEDISKLRDAYKRLIRSTMFVTFILMLGLAAISKPLIIGLIGEKWTPSIVYLQLLCFVGLFYPLHALNLNILQVKGRSDLFLKLEIIKKILAIPVIIVAILLGIKAMILGMIIVSVASFFINSFYSGKFIGYSSLSQLRDILPSFILAVSVNSIVYFESILFNIDSIYLLIIQLLTGFLIVIISCEFIDFKDYNYIKSSIREKFLTIHHENT